MTARAGPASNQPSLRSLRARSLVVPAGAETGASFLTGGSVVVLTTTPRPGSWSSYALALCSCVRSRTRSQQLLLPQHGGDEVGGLLRGRLRVDRAGRVELPLQSAGDLAVVRRLRSRRGLLQRLLGGRGHRAGVADG